MSGLNTKRNKQNQTRENFANASSGSSVGKTLMWIALAIFFIGVIYGLIYFIKSQKLDIDLTRGFKSNLELPDFD